MDEVEASLLNNPEDIDDPANDLPSGAPSGLQDAAREPFNVATMNVGEERGALDFILGPTTAVEFDVPVTIETPTGPREAKFHIRQMDGKKIMATEDRFRDGSGPFAKMDDVGLDAALVSEATLWIEDSTGRRTDIRTEEFIGGAINLEEAMLARFKYSPGLLMGVAAQVRSVSGYNSEKVRSAERAIQDAVGKS